MKKNPIIEAAKEGDTKKLEELVKTDADLHCTEKSLTPLAWAALNGRTEAVEWLMKNHADISKRDQSNNTVLHAAAHNGHTDTAIVIIQCLYNSNSYLFTNYGGINGLEVNKHGQTAYKVALTNKKPDTAAAIMGEILHGNIKKYNIKTMHECIQLCPDSIHYRSRIGKKPISTALQIGAREALEFLIKQGARISYQELLKERETVVFNNTQLRGINLQNFYPLFYYLLNEMLLAAAKIGDIKEISELLQDNAEFRADIRYKDTSEKTKDMTAFLHAAANGHTKAVELLLDKDGKYIFEQNHFSEAQLYAKHGQHGNHKDTSVFLNSIEMIRLIRLNNSQNQIEKLFKEGVDLNYIPKVNDYNDRLPPMAAIHWAAYLGNRVFVKLLLDNGAKLNIRDKFGNTPLIWAANEGHTATCRLLLAWGADVNEENHELKTPLYWAAHHQRMHTVDFLLKRGATFDRMVTYNEDCMSIREALVLQNGNNLSIAKLRQIEFFFTTADSHYAQEKYNLDIGTTRDLTEIGIGINVRRAMDGNTPLYLAMQKAKHIGLIVELINRGADVDLPNDRLDTAFKLAERTGRPFFICLCYIARIKNILAILEIESKENSLTKESGAKFSEKPNISKEAQEKIYKQLLEQTTNIRLHARKITDEEENNFIAYHIGEILLDQNDLGIFDGVSAYQLLSSVTKTKNKFNIQDNKENNEMFEMANSHCYELLVRGFIDFQKVDNPKAENHLNHSMVDVKTMIDQKASAEFKVIKHDPFKPTSDDDVIRQHRMRTILIHGNQSGRKDIPFKNYLADYTLGKEHGVMGIKEFDEFNAKSLLYVINAMHEKNHAKKTERAKQNEATLITLEEVNTKLAQENAQLETEILKMEAENTALYNELVILDPSLSNKKISAEDEHVSSNSGSAAAPKPVASVSASAATDLPNILSIFKTVSSAAAAEANTPSSASLLFNFKPESTFTVLDEIDNPSNGSAAASAIDKH